MQPIAKCWKVSAAKNERDAPHLVGKPNKEVKLSADVLAKYAGTYEVREGPAAVSVAMQAVIPLMRAQGSGSIVNINSGTAFMTVPQYSVYSSSKRPLLGFSLTARAELEKDRIEVSEIYPFITATNFGKNRMGNPAGGGPSSNYADGDKPEFADGLVLQAIEEEQAQYFANDRLRKMAGAAALSTWAAN